MPDNNSKKDNEKTKRVVPVLSYEEFLHNEEAPRGKKIMGAIKIKAEDAEKALKYFENR